MNRHCVGVIPCLNEASSIGPLVRQVRAWLPAVIVVDDGSADGTASQAENAGAEVIRHPQRQGKGAALQTGFRRALERGFLWALAMDGDGQHAPSDIPRFLDRAALTSAALIVGDRFADPASMPWLRRQVNRWMSRQLSRELGQTLRDTQCGFRLLRLDAWASVVLATSQFETDSELFVAFIDHGYSVDFVPVQTIYRNEPSHIRPIHDALRWFRWWRGVRASRRI